MSDKNKAFQKRTAGSQPLSFSLGTGGSISLRFADDLPTELEYPIKDTYDMYSEFKEKYGDILEKELRASGKSDKEILPIIKQFSSEAFEARKMIFKKARDKADEIEPDLVKLCRAFENVAKQKVLEVAHAVDEAEHELEEEIKKLVARHSKATH